MFNKIAKNFFYLEAYINFASGLAMIAKPMSVTESLLGSTNEDENTLEMIRWFGVMVFAFGFYLLHQTLNRNQWDQTKVVFQSFLIDVSYPNHLKHVYPICKIRIWLIKQIMC